MVANTNLLNTSSWVKFDGTAYSLWSAQRTNKLLVDDYWDIVTDQNPRLAPPTQAQLAVAAAAVAAAMAAADVVIRAQQVMVDNVNTSIEN
ncbi:hypothetical protein R1flu_009428 [Riccia fluitans]|uniref:Uncharacterized protein n=1 Tax=Riccia fluitans TaxID=41844 RepID=A0ABD1Z235_9MARC